MRVSGKEGERGNEFHLVALSCERWCATGIVRVLREWKYM